jgi:hypothetical protein
MLSIASTIAPIFLLIVLGYGFKRAGFPGDGFWRPAEKLAYYVLLPALIVRGLASTDLALFPMTAIASIIIGIAVSMTLIGLALRPLLGIDGPGFTSVLQGTIRINSYLAFAVAEALFGNEGVVLCAIFVAFMMPAVNVISIGALAAFTGDGKPDWWKVPAQIARNPIILACVAGWIINTLAIPMPVWTLDLLSILARAALPVALLCVGAGLILAFNRNDAIGLMLACGLKLLIMPLMAWGLVQAFGLTGVVVSVILLFASAPAAPAAYVLASLLGGNAPLMAAILTFQTAFSAITIPIILSLVASY